MSIVDTQHPEYKEMLPRWRLCRDLAEGQCAVHKAGELYLPKLKDETDTDYKVRRQRTILYNAFWRTIAGLSGMLFRKPPVIEVQTFLLEMFDDITMSGVPLQVFAQQCAEETLILGRVGILADYPATNSENMTLAEQAAMNLRPSLQMYKAETIINWRMARIGNKTVLAMVVIKEDFEIRKNEFEFEYEDRYRVLDLDESGNYRQRVFRIDEKGQDELVSEYLPLMNNSTMDAIPFIFIGADNLTPTIEEPALIDMADMNIAHYRVTSMWEHGCFFTGAPTPIIAGYTQENPGDKLYIGSSSAWVFPDPQTKAFYLEFTGQGLGALERNMDRKEQMMAVLGARMLSPDKKMVEAADTASIHRSGENSVLSGIAQNVSQGLTKALQIFSEWAGGDSNVSIELNREFLNMPVSAQDLTALVAAWQAGGISQETLFFNLKAGEIYPDDLEFEEEQGRIDSNPILTMPAPVA